MTNIGIIDRQGFRLNVGIVIVNPAGKLFWGQRAGNPNAWQFPQGGMHAGEQPVDALYRELYEEVGLSPADVTCVAETPGWIYYRLPKAFRRQSKPLCIGQRQKWFLLRLLSDDRAIQLAHAEKPEFDQWRWVDYWYPLQHVISFKYAVYNTVLKAFEAKAKC